MHFARRNSTAWQHATGTQSQGATPLVCGTPFLKIDDSTFRGSIGVVIAAIAVAFAVGAGVASLACILFYARRQRARPPGDTARANRTIDEQHRRLREQFEISNDQLARSHQQAAALEQALCELRESEQRQHCHADRARQLTRRLNEAQQVAGIGYWEIDSATGTVFWSDEMYRICGLPPGTLPIPTDQFLQVIHPDDRANMEQVAANAVQHHLEFTEQYRIVGVTESERTVQAKGRLIVDDLGHHKMVGTVQDITERVQLEAQVRRSQKMDAIGQLAGGVAHDFNNLLTVIDGYASLLLAERLTDEPDRQFLGEIRAAAQRAGGLTRQLLAVSRQQVLQPRILNVNDAIGAVDRMLHRLVGEHIEIHTTLAPDLGLIKADPGQLEQVMMNLVVNARDAMPNGGTLTIETANVILDGGNAHRYGTAKQGAHVALLVSDTGTGIPQHLLDRIFEPFFTTKEAGKGTGLGLSTVQGIVEQSGGHVWVYSEVGHGTTFKVYFPHAAPGEDAYVEPPPAALSHGGHETVLLVEDDAAVRGIACATLRRGGYEVLEASNGVEAVRLCEELGAGFDIVLSDMVMPAMGGRALAIHLRRLRPEVPIVLMSGYSREAVSSGADFVADTAFIEKPFAAEALLKKVRDVLDSRSVGAGR